MPLVKVHVENAVWQERRDSLQDALKPIRAMLCDIFRVDASLCQMAIIPVFGVDDQAPVAAEMQILPRPERTREVVLQACQRLREMLAEASGHVAVVRCTQLDPSTYLALK